MAVTSEWMPPPLSRLKAEISIVFQNVYPNFHYEYIAARIDKILIPMSNHTNTSLWGILIECTNKQISWSSLTRLMRRHGIFLLRHHTARLEFLAYMVNKYNFTEIDFIIQQHKKNDISSTNVINVISNDVLNLNNLNAKNVKTHTLKTTLSTVSDSGHWHLLFDTWEEKEYINYCFRKSSIIFDTFCTKNIFAIFGRSQYTVEILVLKYVIRHGVRHGVRRVNKHNAIVTFLHKKHLWDFWTISIY